MGGILAPEHGAPGGTVPPVRDLRFPQARSPNVWFEPWSDLILFMLGKKQLDIGCGEKSANYDDCRAKDRQRA